MQIQQEPEELAIALQFCIHQGCKNNLIPTPTLLTTTRLAQLHQGHFNQKKIKEFIQTHNEFKQKYRAGTLHSSDELPTLIESRMIQTQSNCKKSNLMFEPSFKRLHARQQFYKAIAIGDVDAFQQKVSRDQYHSVTKVAEYSNAIKQMKEVINGAYDRIDQFIGNTLATTNKAIEELTNKILSFAQEQEKLNKSVKQIESRSKSVVEKEKLNKSVKQIESKSKNVVVIQEEPKQPMPESKLVWTWSTKYKGEKCVIRDNKLNGVDWNGSNCFIEPSFGVNDTRTVKLRFFWDKIDRYYDSYSCTSFQIVDTDIRMKANPNLDSLVESQQGTYCFRKSECIQRKCIIVMDKDDEYSAVDKYPKDLFALDCQWYYLELTYDGQNKIVKLKNTETKREFTKKVSFDPQAKLYFGVSIFTQIATCEIL